MGFLALFSGLLYKGSYNVEVRRRPCAAQRSHAACAASARARAGCGAFWHGACVARRRTLWFGVASRAPQAWGLGSDAAGCAHAVTPRR